MEEVCTCAGCQSQSWIIYGYKIQCSKCGKEYSTPDDLKPADLVSLTNDNF